MKHVAGTAEIKLYICMPYKTHWTTHSTSCTVQLPIFLPVSYLPFAFSTNSHSDWQCGPQL